MTSFDSILCWPKTLRGTVAYLPCLEELKGVHYDVSSKYLKKHPILGKNVNIIFVFFIFFCSENASRFCHLDGNWDNYTNYDLCQHVPDSSAVPEFEVGVELPTIVYYTGYTISLISLTLAIAVFIYFK